MALTDIFTGDPYKEAAEKSLANLDLTRGQIIGGVSEAKTAGGNALYGGQTQAINALQGGFGQARTDINQFSPQALAALLSGRDLAGNALTGAQTSGLAALQSGVGGATGAYDPLKALSGQYAGFAGDASQAQRDALGLNGQEGIARSRQAFQTTPGYDFAKNQAIEGGVRGANVAGMAAGGNTLAALTDLVGNQIAPGQWNQYMTGLSDVQNRYAPLALQGTGQAAGGVANAELTGGTGAANIYTGTGARLADLESTTGRAASGLISGQGTTLADLAARGGLAESGVYGATGPQYANLLLGANQQLTSGLGNLTSQYANAYNTQAAGEMAGAKNLWNLGSSLVTGFGGTSTGSGLLSSLGLGKAA